jgi:ADP-heptose:LPS heptosyltransferase
MSRLTITDRRERALVKTADALLTPAAWLRLGRTRPHAPVRIVCLRLERIGDLMMTLPALADLKTAFPAAMIDLVVGPWNREIAAAIPGIARVETLDAAWLSRDGTGHGVLGLVRAAQRWGPRRYHLAVNFEPDIRSNIVLAAIGASWNAGFLSGGGGALLDTALDYDVTSHVSDNARVLVAAVAPRAVSEDRAGENTHAGRRVRDGGARLLIPESHREQAAQLLARFDGAPKIGLHVSGGRAIKQWPVERFRDVAERLVRDRAAAIVLTGTPADRAEVDVVRAALPAGRVLDLSTDASLLTVAAVLERLDLFVTGDTGPMHIAHAAGTPVVAVFGPSQPSRYGPRGVRDRVVRIDLPCSPCNRIRRPPARCIGHTPDCLAGIETSAVLAAIDAALAGAGR